MLGGLIAGALGGVAKAGMDIADTAIKNRDEDTRRMQGLADRKALIEAEMDLKLKRELAENEREAAAFEKAQDGGRALAAKQDTTSIKGLAGQIGGDAPVADDAEYQKLAADPAVRKIWEDAGYVKARPESGMVALELQAAREQGAPATVRRELDATLKATRAAEAMAVKQSQDDRRLDAKEKADAARAETDSRRADAAQRSADAAMVRAERAGAGGSRAGENLTREERLRYTSLLNETGKRISETERALQKINSTTRRIRPGSSEDQEKQLLISSLNDLKAERQTYQGMLAKETADANKPSAAKGGEPKPASAAPAATPPISLLKEGFATRFKDGQVWTLKGGKAVKVD